MFKLEGFRVARLRGDHIIMTKPGIRRPIVIKQTPKMVSIDHILSNMRTAGITRARYFGLLDQVQ